MLREINSKRKAVLLSIFAALLLALPFLRINFWIFAWFGFVPLFFALEGKSRAKAFLLSYLCGIIFWSLTVYWLVHVTLLGTVILILYLALYFGAFGLIIQGRRPILICSVWVLLEFIRSHLFTGFPWALLGYSQYKNLPVIQIVDITGVWGVSFLVMLVNAAIWNIVKGARAKYVFVILAIILTYGYFKLHQAPVQCSKDQARVAVVQGNIPQELKWLPDTKDYILHRYVTLTEDAAAGKPDLIIWPEAASPGLLGEDDRVFQGIFSLSNRIKIPLLIGSVVSVGDKYFNSALLISDGKIKQRYDKLHLVPFGEYIPLKNVLPFLQTVVPIGDIDRGKKYTLFEIPNPNITKSQINPKSQIPSKFAVLICFEDVFPELSRQFVKRGADFLVNITNDGWYKETTAPYQHLQASVFRAVENRVYLARAANTGISGFISPSGKITSIIKNEKGKDIFVSGYDTKEIGCGKKPLTIYTRFGDYFIAACLILFLFYIARSKDKSYV